MSEAVTLITAIIFFFIGRYSVDKKELNTLKKRVKRIGKPKVKAGVIDYPSAQEIAYRGSEQEKIDKDQTNLIKKYLLRK